jgi:hypothetical protein
MRRILTTLVFASFLVLAAPIHAEDADDTSKEKIEAPDGETAPSVDDQPPAKPSEPVEEDEGKSK